MTELEINVELAQMDLKLHRAKSESKKLAYKAYINGLKETKQQLEEERIMKSQELREFTLSAAMFT